jgi:polyhydroxybutyrate depolymerase
MKIHREFNSKAMRGRRTVTKQTAQLVAAVSGVVLIGCAIGCATRSWNQVEEKSVIHDGIVRNYLVFRPSDSTSPIPLVFNLHGYGSSALQQMMYANMNAVADTAGFIIVYPDAVGKRWNSGIGDSPRWPTPNIDDVGFIDALIDTLQNEYAIDLDRVYACGMSNGGFMSFKLACELSQRIAAVASVTGVVSDSTALNCTPPVAVPVMYIHGTDDPTVPFNGTLGWYSANETVSHWVNLHGCFASDTLAIPDRNTLDGCSVTKIAYTDSLGNEDVVFYQVTGGGHTWPGSAFDLPRAGNTNRDINASDVIWRFFKLQKRLPNEANEPISQRPR